ncbi:unnamed protein product [Aspergillus oryzae]|nr:unnamed protein product [Aspergillus oryzae]
MKRRKHDDRRIGGSWDPKSEDEHASDDTHDNEDIVSTVPIGHESSSETAKEAGPVQHGDQVGCEVGIHPTCDRLDDDIVDGDKDAIGEQHVSQQGNDEHGLLEWLEQLHSGRFWALRWGTPCLDCHNGDPKQEQDHEGGNSHAPSKSDFGDETVDHDGEDHPTDAGACR